MADDEPPIKLNRTKEELENFIITFSEALRKELSKVRAKTDSPTPEAPRLTPRQEALGDLLDAFLEALPDADAPRKLDRGCI